MMIHVVENEMFDLEWVDGILTYGFVGLHFEAIYTIFRSFYLLQHLLPSDASALMRMRNPLLISFSATVKHTRLSDFRLKKL